MLKIDKLTKYYGKIKGIENLSLELNEGEIFGFIGPNGAGKSTTIKCIMNLINKNSGDIYIDGKINSKDDLELKEIIGYLPSEKSLYEDMTVKQILDYNDQFYKKDTSLKRKELVTKFQLDESKKVEQLSLGNLKKLGIVLALVHDPKLIILDEPTSGLDPIMQDVFYNILKEEREKGNTIFYSTHILSEIKKICDRVGIIKDGNLIKVETLKEMKNNNLVIVTIKSRKIANIKIELKFKILEETEEEIKILYNDDINKLIKLLECYNLEKLLIEELSIEDMFIHYYK